MKNILLIVLLLQITSIISLKAQESDLEFYNKIETAFNSEEYKYILSQQDKIIQRSNTDKDSLSAELLYFLGDAYLAFDSLSLALDIMDKELIIRKELPYSDPLLLADIHFNLAYYQQLNSEFTAALNNFSIAASMYKQHIGTQSPGYVESKIEEAKLFGRLGEHKKSIHVLEELLQYDFVKEQYQHAVNKELGLAYFDMGYYSKSEEILSKNLKLIENIFGKESIQYAEGLVTLAIPYYYRSQYSEAEILYTQALDIISKMSDNQLLKTKTKNNLALLYWKIGLYDESINLFRQIITDKETLDNAIAYNNYAQNLAATGQQDSALYYLSNSLKIIENELGKKSELYVRHLKEKAQMLNHVNDLTGYKNLMEESFDASKSILEKSNPEYSKYELNWGIANFRVNNLKKAEKHIKIAHELRSKYLSKNHPLYAESSKELAELTWFQNNPKKAKSYFKETFDNYFAQIEAYFPALSEQQKANFYTNTLRSTFEEYNSFAISYKDKDPELLGDMYNYQLATKGLIMYATAKARKNIFNSDNEELKNKYQNWINTKELIAQLYSMSEEELAQQNMQLDSLISTSKELEKELSRASSDFEDAFVAKDYTWKDVQNELKENEAAIEMIRFRKFKPDSSGIFEDQINYAALLIDKNSKQPQLILFENGKELENKYIKNYRNSIKYKVEDKYSYDFYWKPIAEKTNQYNKIYLSPDGIYNQISVNALYNSNTDKYVLEEQNIQLVTNTKDLIAFNKSKDSNLASAPTLFGFPNYNKGIMESEEQDEGIAEKIVENASLNRGLRGNLQRYIRGNSLVTSLPGTKEEVDKINELYSENASIKPKTYLENQADEPQLKSVNNPQVLHIATHGFFLEDNESGDNETEEDKYSQNPLLKSGLIMAGANSFISSGLNETNQQDGILTAYEAMNLNLNDTELVVLSACETGLGELKNGEGVYGLRRAFQVAGAEAIIMSLWSVDDEATQELMTTFYQNWIGGKDKLTAFNDAQKTIKEKYESPFYWGAFVMVGE